MTKKISEWKPLTIRLNPETLARIDAVAAQRDLKRVDIIREALNRAYRSQAG